jgi:hypothetical protein
MVIKICTDFPLQDPPKIYPNWDFGFENKPSGNPGSSFFVWAHFGFPTVKRYHQGTSQSPENGSALAERPDWANFRPLGDQIGRIFGRWATIYSEQIFENEKVARIRVARFLYVQHTKTGRNIPNDHKICQIVKKLPNCSKVCIPNDHKI